MPANMNTRQAVHLTTIALLSCKSAALLAACLQEGIQELQRLYDQIASVTVEWQGQAYGFTDVCTPITLQDASCRVGQHKPCSVPHIPCGQVRAVVCAGIGSHALQFGFFLAGGLCASRIQLQ